MLAFIRARFADHVIYQSQFIRKWWEDWYGVAKAPATVIINGVDLQTYTPDGAHERPTDHFRLLLLEGSLAGGLNSGLFHAVALAEKLSAKFPMEVVVAGKVDDATQRKLQSKVPVKFLGTVPREQIPNFGAFKSHDVLLRRSTRPARILSSKRWLADCPSSALTAARSKSW